MPLNPTLASNVIFGARVSNNSQLPLMSEVFPGLIDPDLIRYVDTFKRNTLSIAGTSVEKGSPTLTWTGGASIIGYPEGYARPNVATSSSGNGVWVPSGADGEVMVQVEMGDLSGTSNSVGLVFRCNSTANNHWRAIIDVVNRRASLQCRGANSRTFSSSAGSIPMSVGDKFLIRAKFSGQNIEANIAGWNVVLNDAVEYQTVSGSGAYWLNSSSASQHKITSCYIA